MIGRLAPYIELARLDPRPDSEHCVFLAEVWNKYKAAQAKPFTPPAEYADYYKGVCAATNWETWGPALMKHGQLTPCRELCLVLNHIEDAFDLAWTSTPRAFSPYEELARRYQARLLARKGRLADELTESVGRETAEKLVELALHQ
jgi:hypothetical protein